MSGFIGNLQYNNSQSFTTTAGANSNVAVLSSLLLVTAAAANDSIDGFVPTQSPDGIVLFVVNVSNSNSLLISQNTNSTSGYRLIMPPGLSTITLLPGRTVILLYTPGIGWRPVVDGTIA